MRSTKRVSQRSRYRAQQMILRRIVTRIRTGTSFIQTVYLDHHKTPDAAWIRNIYILLSFYTELLLKAVYVYEKKYKSKVDLNKVFSEKYRHNLEKISSDIGSTILSKYGIQEVKKIRTKEYRFKTDLGTYYVKDFIDIRYDFIEGKVRKLKGNEHLMFEIQIASINRIASYLNGPAWS